MFRIIFVLVGVFFLLCLFYLTTRFRRFYIVEKWSCGKKWKSWVLGAIPVLCGVIGMFFAIVPVVVCMLHLAVFWLVADMIQWIVMKCKKTESFRRYYAGAAAIVITILYLTAGWYQAHYVVETGYVVNTEKNIEGLKIVQITDSHIGATFDGAGFAEHMREIEKLQPDVVVLTGDFVDESTTKEDMELGCEAVGKIKTKYGIYFVYGNHDKGLYQSSRGFDAADLAAELEKNGIVILEDENVLINDSVYIIGRKDRVDAKRKSMPELIEGLDKSKYLLVLDHQPTDYEAQKEAEVDLVLSGHTHGGHLIPAGWIGEVAGFNCMTYGIREESDTTFIVSSGISGWAIPFKTGAISEYVVIDVK